MKIRLNNVRIAFLDLFEADKKYGKFGAQLRFDADSKHKELLEDTIEQQGSTAFGGKWPKIKKSLHDGNKIFKVRDGSDNGYDEDYYINAKSAVRPAVHGRDGGILGASDNVMYPGCRVDAIFDVSAFTNKTGDSVVSVKLLGVQFRGDGEPLVASAKADASDFKPITDGADAEDL